MVFEGPSLYVIVKLAEVKLPSSSSKITFPLTTSKLFTLTTVVLFPILVVAFNVMSSTVNAVLLTPLVILTSTSPFLVELIFNVVGFTSIVRFP